METGPPRIFPCERGWDPYFGSMKTIQLIAAMLSIPCILQAGAREFTQKETGKTISGEVVGTNSSNGTVTVALANGKTATFKQDTLIDADREFIAAWAKDYAFVNKLRLSVNKVSGERSTDKDKIYAVKKQKDGFQISIRNVSNTDALESLTVNYTLVIERNSGKVETKSGSHEISYLEAGGIEEFTTEVVELAVDKKSVSSCPKCVEAAAEFKGDDLEGVYIVVEKDGKKGLQTAFPSSREKKIREAIGSDAVTAK